jgi:hypothetical protein
MQVNRDIVYRLAFETASLELYLIPGTMKKLQQEKDRCAAEACSAKLRFVLTERPGAPTRKRFLALSSKLQGPQMPAS